MTYTLRTWGWTSWEKARELLADATGSWLETTALVRSAPLPDVMPRTYRIHAWSPDGTVWRLIPDRANSRVLVTALVKATDSTPTTPADVREAPVLVDAARGPEWSTLIVHGVQPLTFLVGPSGGDSSRDG